MGQNQGIQEASFLTQYWYKAKLQFNFHEKKKKAKKMTGHLACFWNHRWLKFVNRTLWQFL